jgi:ribosome modulation factor
MKYLKLFEQFNEGLEVDEFGSLKTPDCLTDSPDDDPDTAYEKGKEAFDKGYSQEENPFTEPELQEAWLDGFESA